MEGAVQRQQQGHHFMAFVHPSGWNEQQHYPPCNSQISCECTSYTKNPLVKSHSVLSPLTVEAVGIDAFKVDEFSNDIHQQVENLHEWGADSEFVSPHMLETCTHDSSWSTSLPLTGWIAQQHYVEIWRYNLCMDMECFIVLITGISPVHLLTSVKQVRKTLVQSVHADRIVQGNKRLHSVFCPTLLKL